MVQSVVPLTAMTVPRATFPPAGSYPVSTGACLTVPAVPPTTRLPTVGVVAEAASVHIPPI